MPPSGVAVPPSGVAGAAAGVAVPPSGVAGAAARASDVGLRAPILFVA